MGSPVSGRALGEWQCVSYDAGTNDQEPLWKKRGADFVRTQSMNCRGSFAIQDDTLLRLFALNKLLLNIVIIR